jgi:hypothetical protein
MSYDSRFLNMKDAGQYIGQSYRWMQRNYLHLARSGVEVHRFPKGSVKGHLFFSKQSLDKYAATCRLTVEAERPGGQLPEGRDELKILTFLGSLGYETKNMEYIGCEHSV